jgi:hypothetical protein
MDNLSILLALDCVMSVKADGIFLHDNLRPKLRVFLDNSFTHNPITCFLDASGTAIVDNSPQNDTNKVHFKHDLALSFGNITVNENCVFRRLLKNKNNGRRMVPRDARLFVRLYGNDISKLNERNKRDLGTPCSYLLAEASFSLFDLLHANEEYVSERTNSDRRSLTSTLRGYTGIEFGTVKARINNNVSKSMPGPRELDSVCVPPVLAQTPDYSSAGSSERASSGLAAGYVWADFYTEPTKEEQTPPLLARLFGKMGAVSDTPFMKEWSRDAEERKRRTRDMELVNKHSLEMRTWAAANFAYRDTGTEWLHCDNDFQIGGNRLSLGFLLETPPRTNMAFLVNRFLIVSRRHFVHNQMAQNGQPYDIATAVKLFRQSDNETKLVIMAYMCSCVASSLVYRTDQTVDADGNSTAIEGFSTDPVYDGSCDCEEMANTIVRHYRMLAEHTFSADINLQDDTPESVVYELSLLARLFYGFDSLSNVATKEIVSNERGVLDPSAISEHMHTLLIPKPTVGRMVRVTGDESRKRPDLHRRLMKALESETEDYHKIIRILSGGGRALPVDYTPHILVLEGTGHCYPLSAENPRKAEYDAAMSKCPVIDYLFDTVYHSQRTRPFVLNVGRLFTTTFIEKYGVPMGDFVCSYEPRGKRNDGILGSGKHVYSATFNEIEHGPRDQNMEIVLVATPFLTDDKLRVLLRQSRFSPPVQDCMLRKDYERTTLGTQQTGAIINHVPTNLLYVANSIVYENTKGAPSPVFYSRKTGGWSAGGLGAAAQEGSCQHNLTKIALKNLTDLAASLKFVDIDNMLGRAPNAKSDENTVALTFQMHTVHASNPRIVKDLGKWASEIGTTCLRFYFEALDVGCVRIMVALTVPRRTPPRTSQHPPARR